MTHPEQSVPRIRLAIIASHPIQYYAPWFRRLAALERIHARVFYLLPAADQQVEPDFERNIQWDVDLLSGYESEFVPNQSRAPTSARFWGIQNPLLVKRIALFRPDAILQFGYKYWSHQCVIHSPQLRRIPKIFRGDSHVLAEPPGDRRPSAVVKSLLLHYVYGRFAAFLAVGQANAGYYRRFGVPDKKIFFAPHAVDNQRFLNEAKSAQAKALAWREGLGISADQIVFLFAGKFIEKKRPLDLVQAFRQLDPNLPTALLLVGNGPQESVLREAAAGDPNIHFAPFQNQTAMPGVYATGDVLVLPSFGHAETWGLAVNEAFCLARPAIVSDHVGCYPDLIVEGETGWMFPAGNVNLLARRLTQAVQSREKRVEMGKAAQARIRDHYNYKQATAGLLLALQKIGLNVN